MPVPKPQAKTPSQGRPDGLRQPRSRRDLCDTRRRRVNAPVRWSSKHSLHGQALLPRLHRSNTLPFGSIYPKASSPSLAVNGPPSLAMSATTTAMMYSPPPQMGIPPTATAPPILLRPGSGATPYFLHRTPVFQVRSTASLSHLEYAHVRPSAAYSRSSAPAAVRTSDEMISSKQATYSHPQAPRSLVSTHQYAPSSYTVADHPSVPYMSPSKHGYHSRTSSRASRSPPSTPRSISIRSAGPPPQKALPPIPFPTSSAPPEVLRTASEHFERPIDPVRVPVARPVSQDTEATLRELEFLAASLQQMGPAAAARTFSTDRVGRDRDISTLVNVKISAPATTTETAAPRTGFAASVSGGGARQSSASLAVPHIVVTNPSNEDLLEALKTIPGTPVSSDPVAKLEGGMTGEEADDLLWVDQYGAWGTSEKGKWKAVAEEDESGPEEDALKLPPPRMSTEQTFIYEPVGAPEFLLGSSRSDIARATDGFTSRASKRCASRCRRRRPAPLMLANRAQAEVDLDPEMALAAALFFGNPLKKSTKRPATSPLTTLNSNFNSTSTPSDARPRQPSAPTSWLPLKRSHPNIRAGGTHRATVSAEGMSVGRAASSADAVRRSEPIPPMPRTPAPSAERAREREMAQQEQGRPATSWAPSSASVPAPARAGTGTSSEPNSPRPGYVRPRLKSLKGLFKRSSK
ncbi:hypothetical protein C8Q74DRAFT_560756 [Fomes fomentarius]|nr:hypothetical protein C8Q74DRAFT_560756 [Fomes fomentarius]